MCVSHYFLAISHLGSDHMDATAAPTIARLTIPAPGTDAAVASKCRRVSTYATVGDLDSTSITNVRFDRSSISRRFPTTSDTIAPKIGNKQDAATAFIPLIDIEPIMEEAEFAAPPATSAIVDSRPSDGQYGIIRFDIFGNRLRHSTPLNKGVNTKDNVDFSSAGAFITTDVLSIVDINRGVRNAPKIVVVAVHTTDSETSPPANKANKLDACPPPTQPRMIVPALSSTGSCNKEEVERANSGINPKQQMKLETTTRTELGAISAALISYVVVVNPIANMRAAKHFDTTGRLPSVVPRVDECYIPKAAAKHVHSGANPVKVLRSSCIRWMIASLP